MSASPTPSVRTLVSENEVSTARAEAVEESEEELELSVRAPLSAVSFEYMTIPLSVEPVTDEESNSS